MLGLKLFNRRHKLLAKGVGLFLANAVDLDKLVARLWTQAAQTAQGLVGKDHIRRHLQLGRDLLAQGTQALEQLGIVAHAWALIQLGLLAQQIDGAAGAGRGLALGRATLNGKGKRLILDLDGTRTQPHDRVLPLRGGQITAAAQLADDVLDAPDRFARQLTVAAVLVQMHLANALGVAAVKHIGDERLAKAHGTRGHITHSGAGHIGDVLDLELRETVAAVAAALGVVCRAARCGCRMLGRGFVAKVA